LTLGSDLLDTARSDGSSADPFDIGHEAHAARLREIPKGPYFLLARLDG